MTDVVTLLIAALATARLTSLIVHDAILEPIRHELFLLSPPEDDIEQGFTYQSVDRIGWFARLRGRLPGGLRLTSTKLRRGVPVRRAGFLGRLVSCTHCTGIWVAAAVVASLHYWPHPTTTVVAVAAVAQVAEVAVRWARA